MNDEQKGLLQMYKDISRLFDEHGIRYFGMFGTELGAIRHDGFIPWDNDIDLIVICDDMPYISRILNTELDQSKYYYHEPRADCHPHVILKTDDFEKDLKEKKPLFIDIFIFNPYPDGWFRRKMYNFMATMSYVSTYALEFVRSLTVYRLFWRVPRFFEKLGLMAVGPDHRMMSHFVTTFRDDIFEMKDFKEPLIHKFEDTTIPIPMDWEKYLIKYFGNSYMELPPEDKRTGAHGYPVGAYLDYVLDSRKENIFEDLLKNAGVKVSVVVRFSDIGRVYECIRHIRQQTYENNETVFITDNNEIREKVNEQSTRLKDVKIIGPEDDTGGVTETVSGDYIWFIDADDCPSPYFISEMLEIALREGSDVVISNYYNSCRNLVNTPPKRYYVTRTMDGESAAELAGKGKIPALSCSMLIRASFLRDSGIDQVAEEDIICLFQSAEKVTYYNKPLCTHVPDDGSRTTKKDSLFDCRI